MTGRIAANWLVGVPLVQPVTPWQALTKPLHYHTVRRFCECLHKGVRFIAVQPNTTPVRHPCEGLSQLSPAAVRLRGAMIAHGAEWHAVGAQPIASGRRLRQRAIPEATVARLAVYLRVLVGMGETGTATVSSESLATAAGVNSAKLRKDLSYLGSYGVRGVGYDVARADRADQQDPRPAPGPGGRPDRDGPPRPRAGRLRRLRLARVPDRGHPGRRRRDRRHPAARTDRAARGRTGPGGGQGEHRHRGGRGAGRRRPGRLRPVGGGRASPRS